MAKTQFLNISAQKMAKKAIYSHDVNGQKTVFYPILGQKWLKVAIYGYDMAENVSECMKLS